jgi:acyl-CoA thioesterase I
MDLRSEGGARNAVSGRLLLYLATGLVVGCNTPRAEATDTARATSPATSPSASPSAAGRPMRVVFVGTSLTAGLGLDPDSAYPALLQRKADSAGIPARMVNAGVSGETSAGALRRIDWVLREPADVVVLETGANDGLRALQVDSTRANIVAIVQHIRRSSPAARVLLVQMEAPPNLGPAYTTSFHAMFPSIAKEQGISIAPFLLGRVAGVARLNQADGIHPNDAGERIVAENVWGALEPLLRASVGRAAASRAGTG